MRGKILIWILAILILCSSAMATLEDGLVSYWTHDDTDLSGTTSIDSQNNANGTLTNSPTTGVAGVINEQYDFDGTNQWVTLGDDSDLKFGGSASGKDFSIQAWVQTDTAGANDHIFARRAGSNTDCMQLGISSTGNELTFRFGDTANCASNVCSVTTPITWNTSKEYHIVGVADLVTNDEFRLYVDGTLMNTTTCTADANWGANSGTIAIGRLGNYDGYYWDGDIDEVAFFNISLSDSDVGLLYNYGLGCAYPFTGCSGATTDVDFTITDDWNSSSILSFAINLTWQNGTAETYSTSNGTVSLNNVSDTNININVTYWNMTNYFDRTLINEGITANVSNTVTTTTYQAYVCFNASSKVSGAGLIPDNITIESTTHASCFNITAGSHNVQAQMSGWFPQNQTFTVTALTNTTQTVQNMSYANLTVYAVDGTTNQSLSGYDLYLNSISYPAFGESASTVTNHSFYLINGTYNVTIVMPGYAVTEAVANITVSGNTNYTFTLYLSNSVSITIRDEITNNLITDNVTVRWSDNSTTWENITSTGSLFVSNISSGNYTLLFYSTNFSTRTYSITVGPSSHQFLTAYMISSTYSTIFTIKDIDTGTILDGVSITMYKLINSTWTTVESKVSDISGKAQFYYDPIANYRFYLSYTGYQDYVFYLNPILFSTYDVYMTKESVLNYSVDFDDISFIYSPTTFNNNANISMNFLISSPSGMLTNYGISVTYPGGNDSASGVNAIGEQLTVDVNVTNATSFDYVVLQFNYTTSLAGTRYYTFNLPINMNVSAGTWLTNKDKTYGLGIFERMLIATLIIIFIVGIATMVGQALPGVALGMFVYGFLVFIGFVPLWAILPSMLIGVLFLIWKSGGY